MVADLCGIPLIIIHMGFREKFGSGPGAQKRDTRDTRILQWTWQHGPMDTRASRADATAESNSVLCSEPAGPIRLKHQLSIKGIMWNVAKPQWSPALATEKWNLSSGAPKKWHFSFNVWKTGWVLVADWRAAWWWTHAGRGSPRPLRFGHEKIDQHHDQS